MSKDQQFYHSRERERERVIFSTTEEHKRKTITTIAWKVPRKANQPIKAGDPLSYTPVTMQVSK